jgi:hypothetical protein
MGYYCINIILTQENEQKLTIKIPTGVLGAVYMIPVSRDGMEGGMILMY